MNQDFPILINKFYKMNQNGSCRKFFVPYLQGMFWKWVN